MIPHDESDQLRAGRRETPRGRASAHPGARVVETRDGPGTTRWTVYESSPSDLPGRVGQRSLIFASDMAVRRVWDFPADWRDLADESLLALSWKT